MVSKIVQTASVLVTTTHAVSLSAAQTKTEPIYVMGELELDLIYQMGIANGDACKDMLECDLGFEPIGIFADESNYMSSAAAPPLPVMVTEDAYTSQAAYIPAVMEVAEPAPVTASSPLL
jgi:hypothetical protein